MVSPEKKTILFTLVYKEEQYPVRTAPAEFPSLMSLISQHIYVSGFGLCSGMGSCGTCMVTIRSRQHHYTFTHGLSCAIAITDELANTEIIIPEEYY